MSDNFLIDGWEDEQYKAAERTAATSWPLTEIEHFYISHMDKKAPGG